MIEDQATIALWAEVTFGPPSSPLRVAWRAMEEMAEAGRRQSSGGTREQVGEELADVAIVLFRLAALCNVDLVGGQAGLEHVELPDGDQVALSIGMAARELTHTIYFLSRGMDAVGMPYALLRTYRWLDRAAGVMALDLRALIDAKMVINRKRVWNLSGDGHGYHVREKEKEVSHA